MYNAIYQHKGNVSTVKNVNECNNSALFLYALLMFGILLSMI